MGLKRSYMPRHQIIKLMVMFKMSISISEYIDELRVASFHDLLRVLIPWLHLFNELSQHQRSAY